MDFYQIKEREGQRKNTLDVYPDFRVVRSRDLMVRGKQFYGVWDEEKGLWSTDEYDVQRLVDQDLENHEIRTVGVFAEVNRKYLHNFSSMSWLQFRNYIAHLSDSHTQLDANLTFANTEVKKSDYVSRRLPYALAPGDISAWDEIVSTLYDPEERAKIEWAIGAIVAGDSKTIQKFLVFYGAPGTGKSTILNIIEWMFTGYVEWFVAKELTGANNSFALEAFKKNPLVAIEHDGDLSKIIDNSKLNSLVAHENMQINEKNKPLYSMAFNAMLMIGSNKPVRITDSKAGIIRRLIDIHPTGKLMSGRKYQALMNQVKFELGAIAYHCLEVYRNMGKDYYSGYKPTQMMLETDVFFNFIESHFDIFKAQNGVTLNQAYELYKTWIDESGIEHKLARYKLREELKSYFDTFEERAEVDGVRVRSWFGGFNADRFKTPTGKQEDAHMFTLVMDEDESLFDREFRNRPAQYSKADGFPEKFWTNAPRIRNGEEYIPDPEWVVSTKLKDLDTTKEHYVKVPVNHIVIDFDLKGADGEKSAERNLEAASQWPPTYAEFSKSGAGIHLHYNYTGGDPSELSRIYDEGIEVKVFTGDSSLRRMLTACNNVPVADISSGLPIKEKKVINSDTVKSERALRELIERNMRKEIHPGTKPSIDFIHKILDDAYKSELPYDVTDMRQRLLSFATKSSNNAIYCIKQIQTMQFKSESVAEVPSNQMTKDERLVFFDVEVFPNLFVICWKFQNDKDPFSGKPKIVRMINPSAQAVEELLSLKLVGFNCRRYDNHILYGAYMGYNNEQLYKLSQKIISGSPNAYFGEAYNISYVDIFDFSSLKQSLKKFELELGIPHKELGLPWDQPVPERLWLKVAEYCDNDVMATEETFEARKEDFIARQILSDLSGLPVNSTTQQHTSKIVFGDDRKPQEQFVYTDLSEMFPGYHYEMGKSTYRGEITGEGGYVYAEPGMYDDVALLDVASMHPTSIEQLDLFGETYTKNFSGLKAARIAIKRGDYEAAKSMLGGKLARHLNDPSTAEALSYALKIVINIVYGLTSAKFDNSFKDPRNIDNIVAKRGALFMIELKHMVQEKGFTVAHIKTDSIKIPNATPEIIEEVMEFGAEYGYEFEHEATYKKFCLVNDAVYIAKVAAGRKPEHWEAVGAQFQQPVVFKTLFSHEPLEFRDFCETKLVTTAMYLDFSAVKRALEPKQENDVVFSDVPRALQPDDDTPMALLPDGYLDGEDFLNAEDMHFVGKAGLYCPIMPGHGGGLLMREKEGKFYAVGGTKGYEWMEAEMVEALDYQDHIDKSYYDKQVNDALEKIAQYGDFERFIAA